MQRGTRLIWIAVSLLAVADLLLCRHLQLQFYHWIPLASACAVVTAIGLFYHLTGRSAVLARAAYWTLLWLLFVNAGTVLIYVAAACGGTAHDSTLAAADAALGFDWRGWYDSLAPHRGLRFALWLAYSSLFPQILLSIFWFSSTGADDTNYELLLTNIVSLLATTAIFFGFPAIGHQTPGRELEIATLAALRAGGPLSFDLSQLQGLISFPSYHTVLAVLLTHAHRGSRLRWPIAALNGLMLFSIPIFGGHYLIDMIAGAAVAGFAIALTTAACCWFERAGAGYIVEQATLPPSLPEQSPIAARPTIR
jgi:hypothetical protein